MKMKLKIKGKEVKEVWETYNGDLYFQTQKQDKDGYTFGYARLYSMPQFAEFGSFNILYLKKQYGKYKIWKVDKKKWSNLKSYKVNGLTFESEVEA